MPPPSITRRTALRYGGLSLSGLLAGCNRTGTTTPSPAGQTPVTQPPTPSPTPTHTSESTETITQDSPPESFPIHWKYATGGTFYGRPAVTDDAVYVVGNSLYTFSVDGGLRWQARYPYSIGGNQGPVVGTDVYLLLKKTTPTDRVIAAIRKGGDRRWVFDRAVTAIRILAADDDTVYAASTSHEASSDGDRLFAIDAATGEPRWDAAVGSPSCAVRSETTVYVGNPKRIRAFDIGDGTQHWVTAIEADIRERVFTEIIGMSSDTIYVAGSAVHALAREDGTPRWTYNGQPPERTFGTLLTEDGLFVGVARQEAPGSGIAAVDPASGRERWVTGQYDRIVSPRASSEGTVYAVGAVVAAIDTDSGTVQWEWSPGNQDNIAETIVAGDTLFNRGIGLYGLGLDGSERWRTAMEVSRLAAAGDTVYTGANGIVYALQG